MASCHLLYRVLISVVEATPEKGFVTSHPKHTKYNQSRGDSIEKALFETGNRAADLIKNMNLKQVLPNSYD